MSFPVLIPFMLFLPQYGWHPLLAVWRRTWALWLQFDHLLKSTLIGIDRGFGLDTIEELPWLITECN